jgi:hypothetical protein
MEPHLPVVTYDTTAARIVIPRELITHQDGPYRVTCTCLQWARHRATYHAALAEHHEHTLDEQAATGLELIEAQTWRQKAEDTVHAWRHRKASA